MKVIPILWLLLVVFIVVEPKKTNGKKKSKREKSKKTKNKKPKEIEALDIFEKYEGSGFHDNLNQFLDDNLNGNGIEISSTRPLNIRPNQLTGNTQIEHNKLFEDTGFISEDAVELEINPLPRKAKEVLDATSETTKSPQALPMTSTQSRTATVVSRIVTNSITTSNAPPIARVAAVPTYQTVAPTVAQRVITLVPTICTIPRGKQSKSRRMLVHQLRLQTSKLGLNDVDEYLAEVQMTICQLEERIEILGLELSPETYFEMDLETVEQKLRDATSTQSVTVTVTSTRPITRSTRVITTTEEATTTEATTTEATTATERTTTKETTESETKTIEQTETKITTSTASTTSTSTVSAISTTTPSPITTRPSLLQSPAVDENILVLEMTTDTPDDIFDLVDDDMEYSGSGDFITADVNSISNESEKDLFFTVPLVSETSTSKTVDKTVTKAKMLDIETDTNVTCDESGFCSDPMPTDISLEDFFGFDTMTKLQNTGLKPTVRPSPETNRIKTTKRPNVRNQSIKGEVTTTPKMISVAQTRNELTTKKTSKTKSKKAKEKIRKICCKLQQECCDKSFFETRTEQLPTQTPPTQFSLLTLTESMQPSTLPQKLTTTKAHQPTSTLVSTEKPTTASTSTSISKITQKPSTFTPTTTESVKEATEKVSQLSFGGNLIGSSPVRNEKTKWTTNILDEKSQMPNVRDTTTRVFSRTQMVMTTSITSTTPLVEGQDVVVKAKDGTMLIDSPKYGQKLEQSGFKIVNSDDSDKTNEISIDTRIEMAAEEVEQPDWLPDDIDYIEPGPFSQSSTTPPVPTIGTIGFIEGVHENTDSSTPPSGSYLCAILISIILAI